ELRPRPPARTAVLLPSLRTGRPSLPRTARQSEFPGGDNRSRNRLSGMLRLLRAAVHVLRDRPYGPADRAGRSVLYLSPDLSAEGPGRSGRCPLVARGGAR